MARIRGFMVVSSVIFLIASFHTSMTGGLTREGNTTLFRQCTVSPMQEDTVTISGRIFVGGHEPFTILAAEMKDGSSVVLSADDSLYAELWELQDEMVILHGYYRDDPLYDICLHVLSFRKKVQEDSK